MKPSPPGACWSLHSLKNVGRDLATSVTFTRGAAPVGAQPPGSEHEGSPRHPTQGLDSHHWLYSPGWCGAAWSEDRESRREWGMLLLAINQSIKGKVTSSPAWHNPDVNAALHVYSYLTSAGK